MKSRQHDANDGRARTNRKGLSKRTRFEIFKRDGFACRYCGRSPAAAPLHVDHVVPVAAGGHSQPENLVTACDDCNLGKSSVPLDDIKLRTVNRESLKRQRDHAEQIAAFLQHEKAIQGERQKVSDMLANAWEKSIGPMSQEMYDRFQHLQRTDPIPVLLEAMSITGARWGQPGSEYRYEDAMTQQRYFSAVMRNWRANGRFGAPR